MKCNMLYIIILATTLLALPKVHCKGGRGGSSGGSSVGGSGGSSGGSSVAGRGGSSVADSGGSSGGSSIGGSGGSSKSGAWLSSGSSSSRNSYKPDYTSSHNTRHSNSDDSSSTDWDSYRNFYEPHYTTTNNLPAYNYENVYSDSFKKNDYNSFSNGYLTERMLAEIFSMHHSIPKESEYSFPSETEINNPLEINNLYSQFDTNSYEPKIVLPHKRTEESKVIFDNSKPELVAIDVKIEATYGNSPPLENMKPSTNEDPTIIQNLPAKVFTREFLTPSLLPLGIKCKQKTEKSAEIINAIKEICDILPIETATNNIITQDISTLETTTKSFYQKLTSPTTLPRDINCKNTEIKGFITESCNPFETTTNKIIKKEIPTTTMEPNLEATTKWYYRKLTSTTSFPQNINCRRVMNSVLNDNGEIIDSVTVVCDPPTTTTTIKPILKITTLKPITTSTAKPYVTVCRPVMNSYLADNGEIIDSVNEVCTLQPAT